MISFQSLFGIPASHIKPTCILMPFLPRAMSHHLGLNKLAKGRPYSCAQHENFTVICTQVGASFVGDAVLYLQDSPCENMILLGSCGLVAKNEHLDIGSIVLPERCMALESFCHLLDKKNASLSFYEPDKNLYDTFLENDKHQTVKPVRCASFGSVHLEQQYIDFLLHNHIHCMDMECAAFFNATAHIERKALALFYVTDLLNDPSHHVYRRPALPEAKLIKKAQLRCLDMIVNALKHL